MALGIRPGGLKHNRSTKSFLKLGKKYQVWDHMTNKTILTELKQGSVNRR